MMLCIHLFLAVLLLNCIAVVWHGVCFRLDSSSPWQSAESFLPLLPRENKCTFDGLETTSCYSKTHSQRCQNSVIGKEHCTNIRRFVLLCIVFIVSVLTWVVQEKKPLNGCACLLLLLFDLVFRY